MGKLKISYPFTNDAMFSPELSSSDIVGFFTPIFLGEKSVASRYGTCTITAGHYNGGQKVQFNFKPNFSKSSNFTCLFPSKLASGLSFYINLTVDNSSGQNGLAYNSEIRNKDYTTLPLYQYETDSTYMFAIDNLNNFIIITERCSIDDPSIKSCAIFIRKTCSETSDNPLGVYEWNDSTAITSYSQYSKVYNDDNLYNAHNIGYCCKYSLYQYTRDGYIYPDIYYCDGGLSVPPDGIIRIGTSNFMKLGSNLFLRID